jgi:hypothetical protein
MNARAARCADFRIRASAACRAHRFSSCQRLMKAWHAVGMVSVSLLAQGCSRRAAPAAPRENANHFAWKLEVTKPSYETEQPSACNMGSLSLTDEAGQTRNILMSCRGATNPCWN